MKVNADLLKSWKDFDLSHISFQYFEANEGKNISYSTGSIIKCAFQRGIMKHNEGITTAAEIVNHPSRSERIYEEVHFLYCCRI